MNLEKILKELIARGFATSLEKITINALYKEAGEPDDLKEDVEKIEALPEDAPKVEENEEEEVEKAEIEDEKVEKQIKSLGKTIANEIGTQLKDIKKDLKEADSTIAKFLNGKNLKDVDSLTKEEKIVGFYNALVTDDQAVLKALSEGTAADGGYLFPDEFRAEIIKTLEGPWSMRGLVRTIPMKRDVMKIPTVATRPKVTWTEENETKSTTTASFGEATLTVKKVAAILYSSDELIEDSTEIDVVKLIIDLFAEAFKDEEDRVICQGNGTTQPTGLVTARAAGTIASINCAGNLDFDDLKRLKKLLKPGYRSKATWLISTNNVLELDLIKDNEGKYIYQESVVAGQPDKLLGLPVIEIDWVGDANIFLGDYKRGYWLGDRHQMRVKISQDTETAFTKDQTAIRVVERIAGNVVLGEAIKALIQIP